MNRVQMAAAAVMLCCPCAFADPVFFDDFDGDDLKPWWQKPPRNQWDYTVANSLLTVTSVNYGEAIIHARFDPVVDAEATAAVGWEDSDQHNRVFHFSLSSGGKFLAALSFTEKFAEDLVVASVDGGQFVLIPAPPPGFHNFVILQQAGEFHFFLDDALVASLPDSYGGPVTGVSLHYWGAGPGQTMLADRVQVAPAPGLVGPGLAVIVAGFNRRRRI